MNNLTFGWEKLFQWAPRGQGNPLSKIQKSLIQNGGPNPHRKFQHSNLIRRCLKIRETFGGLKPPRQGQGDENQHAPSHNLFQHAFWQGIRRENIGRKKGLLVLAIDLSIVTS